MGGVGDEAAADLLGGLEPAGELVELGGQLAELVVALEGDPVAVLALPDLADGLQHVPHPAGEGPGEHHAHHQHRPAHPHRHGAQAGLDVVQEPGLVAVDLIEVHRADDHAPVHHGDGGTAAEGPVPVRRVGHVPAVQGGGELAEEGVLPLHVPEVVAVVEHQAGGVGHQHPHLPHVVHGGHEGALDIVPHRVRGEGGGAGQGVGDHRRLGLEQVGLGPEDQVLGGQHRVGVQQHQHRRDDDHIGQGEFQLKRPAEGDLLPRRRPGTAPSLPHGASPPSVSAGPISRSSGNSPPPTW